MPLPIFSETIQNVILGLDLLLPPPHPLFFFLLNLGIYLYVLVSRYYLSLDSVYILLLHFTTK